MRRSARSLAFVAALAAAFPAVAQEGAAPPPPVSLGFDLRAGYAPRDDGYFNITDYQHDALRLFRLDLSVEARAGRKVALLAQGVSENLDARIRALYLRVTPFETRSFDLQAGLIPPVFGLFPRRAYGDDSPLIGLPVAYQYLTTMRADAVPAGADDLLAVRGRGWEVTYPTGSFPPGPGLPLASSNRWDTGVEIHVGRAPVEATVAVTRGTLCDPLVHDNNDSLQLAGRVALQPSPAFTLGLSGARGAYLAESVIETLPASLQHSYAQTALGLDVEHARGHLLLRAEVVATWWEMPPLGSPAIVDPLRAVGGYLEGRYRVAAGWTLGARVDRLAFSTLQGSVRTDTWDANVTRVEGGVSWSPRRHLILRAVYQYNWRDTARFSREGFLAGQLGLWF
jgi:hypothetical protein